MRLAEEEMAKSGGGGGKGGKGGKQGRKQQKRGGGKQRK